MESFVSGFETYLLILVRMTSFILVAPVFSTRIVQAGFKIGFSGMLALLIFITSSVTHDVNFDAFYVLIIIKEIFVGLLMGYLAYLFFTLVQTAGALIDLQMGFGMANIIDPMSGTSAPMMGNFKFMIATLIFLSLDGHHYLIKALLESYTWIPIDNYVFSHFANGDLSTFFAQKFAETFMLALQLSAPLIVSMFLTDVALGFLARTAPQYNVFVIGAPLKILIGFFMIMLIMPGLVTLFREVFTIIFSSLEQMILIIKQPVSQ